MHNLRTWTGLSQVGLPMALTELTAERGNPSRGAAVGMLLGAGLWTGLVFGAIVIFKQ